MHPALIEAPDLSLSSPRDLATDLAPLLRRIFWLVHAIRRWTPPSLPTGPDKSALSILAAAPFHEWGEVARQIQEDLKPETWKIERKENNGLPARTLIYLRKSAQNYQVEILPLRGFKPARFFYDYQRGELLQALLKIAGTHFLHLNPNGLYFEDRLVMTNPPHLASFFGLNPKTVDTISSTPAQLYSQIVQSPFFDPGPLTHSTHSTLSTPSGQTHGPTTLAPAIETDAPTDRPFKAFKIWLNSLDALPPLPPFPPSKSRISKPEIEERLHCINSGNASPPFPGNKS